MGWKLLDRPKTQKVTKNLAKQFAEMEAAPHDRPLSERRLQVYQRLLKEGQFRPVTWATAICTETGQLYRVNGKHTSIMLSGMEVLPDFYVTVEEYECDSLDDVARLYATFDSKMQSRTANDIYMNFAATVTELANIPQRVICTTVSGIAYHKFGQDVYGRTQPAERAEMLLDHPDFVLWLVELLSGGPSSTEIRNTTGYRGGYRCGHFLKQPVVSAMFASWLKAKGPATEFWSAVRDESGATPGLPDRKLAKYLSTTAVVVGSRGRTAKSPPREIYVKCLHAWNAWRAGETTNLNYRADVKVPTAR